MKENISIGIAILAIVISVVAVVSTVIMKPVGVSGNEIADNSVTSSKVADGTLMDKDISDSADIDPSKILGTVWTTTNDGSGSGLDADTVDGKDASAFVNKSYVDNRIGESVIAYSASATLTADASTILEGTINAPSNGYIIAHTTGYLQGDHGASWAAARIFLTDDPTVTYTTMITRAFLGSTTVGGFNFPFSVVGRFTATEGSNTIYVRGYTEGAGTLDEVWSINLILMFVPN